MTEIIWRRAKHFSHYLYQSLKYRGFAMLCAFMLVQAAWFSLITPLSLVVTNSLFSWYGSEGVANNELLAFFLSPAGFLLSLWYVGLALFSFFMHQGVIVILLAQHEASRRSVSQALRLLLARSWLVARLALLQSSLLMLAFSGLLLLGRMLFNILLSEWDINFYLSDARGQLWLYLGAMLLLLSPLALWLSRQWLLWWLSIPIGLLSPLPLRQVLSESSDLNRGYLRYVFWLLMAWAAVRVVAFVGLAATVLWGMKYLLAWWVPQELHLASLALPVAVLILAASLLSFVDHWLYSSIQFYYFRLVRKRLGYTTKTVLRQKLRQSVVVAKPLRWLFLFAAMFTCWQAYIDSQELAEHFIDNHQVEIMGHRAGGFGQYENTIAGLNKAIELQLRSTEIDVQLTADDQVVVFHDRDLQRIAASSLEVSQASLWEIQQAFQQRQLEAPQTLDYWLAAAKGKIKLNIELKRYDQSFALVAAVIEALSKQQQAVIVSSLDHLLLERFAEQVEQTGIADRVELAIIKAASIGSSEQKADVPILVVNSRWVTPLRFMAAKQRGQQIYVWTINSPAEMQRMYYLGVDGIITDELRIATDLFAELEQQSDAERLLNRFNQWLSFW